MPSARSASHVEKALQVIPDKNWELAEVVEDRGSLAWWMGRYLLEYASGTPSTLRFKREDLGIFLEFFCAVKSNDRVHGWSRATTNLYLQSLTRVKTAAAGPDGKTAPGRGRAKVPGSPRWSARSVNRKLDHLRTFSRWLRAQMPPPIIGDPFERISRLDVPALEAKRFTEAELEALTTTARNLVGTEVSRDVARYRLGEAPARKTARPQRDYTLFSLLLGSGLRVSEVINLDLDQFGGQRRLYRVKTKGLQERGVVISEEAARALRDYVAGERAADAAAWPQSRALFLPIAQLQARRPGTEGRLDASSAWAVIRKIAVRALGPEHGRRVHPHLFRHHMGYVMMEQGGITAVQRQLGHRNIAYSAVYSQRTEAELEGFMDREGTV